jgi:steroid delta-isomerase-like uncharacterized protein
MDWNAYLDAWNRHDGAGVASFFTDDGVFTDHALGRRHQGRDSIAGFVESAAEEVSSDYELALLDTFQAGDRYALVWTFGGTNDRSNPDPPLPATGKQFSVRGVSIGRLEGDRITENTDYWNLAEFLAQLGLMPAPAGTSG